MRTKNYSDALGHIAALIGAEVADLQTAELAIINTFFNKAMKYIWQEIPWVDVCPMGEYRVPNNQLTFASTFGNSAWTKTNVAVSADALANPVDIQSNADQLLETSTTGAHNISQSVTFTAQQNTLSVFAIGAGRNFIRLSATDSASATYSGFFNLSAGTVGTLSGCTATITQISAQWYQCTITFTPAFGSGSVAVGLSSDGSTLSYAGNTSLGVYLWGSSLIPSGSPGVSAQLIPWEQPGEEPIDVPFEVWQSSPLLVAMPSRVGYQLTNNGIQIIGGTSGFAYYNYVATPNAASTTSGTLSGPVYLYYRKRVPDYTGSAYSASATYAYADQIYYTTASGNSNYYSALATTVAGENPETTPSKWRLLAIPYAFFDYAVYSTFADWLRTEGQIGKAQVQDQMASDILDRETDRQERQMGLVQPMRVHTHLTSRPGLTR